MSSFLHSDIHLFQFFICISWQSLSLPSEYLDRTIDKKTIVAGISFLEKRCIYESRAIAHARLNISRCQCGAFYRKKKYTTVILQNARTG